MLRDRLITLFQQYDPALRQVILEVLEVEQEFISMERCYVVNTILRCR